MLRYDHELMHVASSGQGGVGDEEFRALLKTLDGVRGALADAKKGGGLSFVRSVETDEHVRASLRAASTVRKKAKTLVVVGIGGSDLGAKALIRALGTEGADVRFAGASVDPETVGALLDGVDPKTCAINIVSKSGDTIEPTAVFFALRDRLEKKIGKKKTAERIVATTGRTGALRDLADKEGYRTLDIPGEVGGRFSVFTPVGLFPAVFAGVPVRRLVLGARAEVRGFFSTEAVKNGALLFAGLQHAAYARRFQHVTVLMPYVDALEAVALWFRQLWAESLGKKVDRGGKIVHQGLTPIVAMGPADQHSQLQLYQDGPADKVVTFIETLKYRREIVLPKTIGRSMKFGDLSRIERQATARSLASAVRPSGTIMLDAIGPESVGALLVFFMLATSAMGELLDINVYDQPGVEESKRMIREALDEKSRKVGK